MSEKLQIKSHLFVYRNIYLDLYTF